MVLCKLFSAGRGGEAGGIEGGRAASMDPHSLRILLFSHSPEEIGKREDHDYSPTLTYLFLLHLS